MNNKSIDEYFAKAPPGVRACVTMLQFSRREHPMRTVDEVYGLATEHLQQGRFGIASGVGRDALLETVRYMGGESPQPVRPIVSTRPAYGFMHRPA